MSSETSPIGSHEPLEVDPIIEFYGNSECDFHDAALHSKFCVQLWHSSAPNNKMRIPLTICELCLKRICAKLETGARSAKTL